MFLLILGIEAKAQTCCSAGAPINTQLGVSNLAARSTAIQLRYEYQNINRLVNQNEILKNDPRTRQGQNTILKVDYMVTNKIAISGLLPLVYQNRTTVSEDQSSLGLGDLALLGQYNLIHDKSYRLSAGAGIKVPTGKTNHTDRSGIFLSPDMQSGSGSFDYLFRISGVKMNFIRAFLHANFSLNYRLNSVNENFAASDNFGGRSFAFGDELLATIGFNYQFVTKNGFWIPDLILKYRWVENNLEQEIKSPNSGGSWLILPLGISFVPTQKISFRTYIELPITQNLAGLQITANFAAGFQIKYNLSPIKKKLL